MNNKKDDISSQDGINNVNSDLLEIFDLLKNEKSIKLISEDLIKKICRYTSSEEGHLVFLDEDVLFSYVVPGSEKPVTNSDLLIQEAHSSSVFLRKWFEVNKEPIIVGNNPMEVGYNFIPVCNSKSLLLAPLFFNNRLSAIVIILSDSFPKEQAANAMLFTGVLSFAISNIKTQETNTALENKLLQTQKLETVGKLAGGIAHDFSNLLSSIFGSVNLLRKKAPDREDIIRLLDNIENCSVRAKDLTKSLMSFGKPTAKRRALIDPNILVTELIKVITQTFPKQIEFVQEIDENLNNFLGNDTEIYQVLLNLCINAKEALEGKGFIKFKVCNITINDSNINEYPLLIPGNYIKFSVSDNGSGISEENLQKIFDPYFSTKQKEQTSGLGLYVSYGIIKAHKGQIEVKSELGKGTSFEVFIPALESEIVEKSDNSYKIILLADDEYMLRDLLAELLESNNYAVIKVGSGAEVLKVLTEEILVDLLIIDYNMPEMDGLECVKRIRTFNTKIPIILSTGSISLTDEVDFRDYGLNSIVPKPYEFETMLNTIKKLI
ncbi:MAG: response regulator [Bacteroidota bacterium]|nr:response regulator [Bacteroidota bacterium]